MKHPPFKSIIPTLAAILSLASSIHAGEVSAEADAILQAMSKKLAGTSSFTVKARRSLSKELAESYHAPVNSEIDASAVRPNRFAGKSVHGDDVRHIYFDGNSATIHEVSHKVYGVVPAKGSIDDLVDHLEHAIGITPPLADFIVADPYKSLLTGKPSGKIVGSETVGGMECRHLSFAQEGLKWEVWVGDDDLPHRFVIHYLDEGKNLSVTVDEINWNLEPEIEDSAFSFTPPDGVRKMDITTPEALEEKK